MPPTPRKLKTDKQINQGVQNKNREEAEEQARKSSNHKVILGTHSFRANYLKITETRHPPRVNTWWPSGK